MKIKKITNGLVRYSDFRALFPLFALTLISAFGYTFFPLVLKVLTLVIFMVAGICTFKDLYKFNPLGAIIPGSIFTGFSVGFFFYDFVGLIIFIVMLSVIFVGNTLPFIRRRRKVLSRIKARQGLQPA
jgi:hypothetical protein